MLRENLQTLLTLPLSSVLGHIQRPDSNLPVYGPVLDTGPDWATIDNRAHTLSGTAVDALAAHLSERGVSVPDAYTRAAALGWEMLGVSTAADDNLGVDCHRYRMLLHLVNNPRLFGTLNNGHLQMAEGVAAKKLEHRRAPPGVYTPMDPRMTQKLCQLLKGLGISTKLDPNQTVLCTAFYMGPGILAGLELQRLWVDEPVFVELLPARLMLSGLSWSGLYAGLKPVAGSEIRALSALNERTNARSQHRVVSWARTGDGQQLPNQSCDWLYHDHRTLEAGLWATRGLDSSFLCGEQVSDRVQVTVRSVLELTGNDSLPKTAKNLLQADGPSPETVSELREILQARGRARAARAVESEFGRGILTQQGGVDILLTEKGLAAHDQREDAPVLITNFTLRGQQLVVFPDRAQDMLQFEVRCESASYPVMVPESVLGTGQKLSDYLQSLETEPGRRPPRVLDPSRMGPVLRWAREQASTLPVVHGLSHLGWNGIRDQFSTRAWTANAQGVNRVLSPCAPGVVELQCFGAPVSGPLETDLPAPVCDLVSAVIAQVVRHYLGYGTPPIEVVNNSWNRRVLETVFKGLGQIRALPAPENGRQSPARALHGLPAWTLGLSRAQVRACEQPLWVLGEAGIGWEWVAEDRLEAGARALGACLEQVVAGLMSGKLGLAEPARRVLHRAALVEEGAKIVRQAMGLTLWPQSEPGYPHLERLLSGMDPEQSRQTWLQDLRDQKLYLYREACPHVHEIWDEVLIELATLVKSVRVCEVGAVMDPTSGLHFLRQYHGGDPPVGTAGLGWAMRDSECAGAL